MADSLPDSLSAPPPRRLRLILPAAVFVISFAAFLPALKGQFVNWDDDILFVNNQAYRGLGIAQIEWMFSYSVLGHYQPITWLTHGADYCLWGMNPFGYHLTNLLFHAACAVFVYLLAVRILRCSTVADDESTLRLAAAFAALLFAIHPLRVESVAWVTERRDLVCTFFLIPSVLCYLRYAVGPSRPGRLDEASDPMLWYIASLVLFAMSLLSKAWGMTLPVVLLVLDVYPLRRLRLDPRALFSKPNRGALSEKLPYAVLAFLAAKIALMVQSFAGMETLAAHTPLQRLAQACYGLVFYVAKTLLPTALNPIYEFPVPFNPFGLRFVVAAVALVGLVAIIVALRRRLPSLMVAFAVYAIILSPVLGITQTGPQLVADRYSYLACIPFAILAAATGCALDRKFGPGVLRRLAPVPLAILLLLAVLTWRQCGVWRDSSSLWRHAVTLDPDSCNARNNLGFLLAQQGRHQEALLLFQFCVQRRPDKPLFQCNLAAAEKELGFTSQALEHVRRALDLRPPDVERLLMIAQGLADLGDDRRSLQAARLAIDADPADARCHFAAGQALFRLGDVAAASESLIKAVELFDRKFPPGAIDPRTEPQAGLYKTACAILSDYFEKKRDYDQAAIYRDKGFRTLGP